MRARPSQHPSNILDFISANVAKALEQPFLEPLQV